ncbi:hypothetical protein AB0K05_03210 [Nonomuraea sp. NPDC049486]|uniref:hypothetical protein n=1 Tax=Nonomuraea sp. NPDC049486 TaxID=3155773 RepID=UPI003433BD71
MPATRVAGIDPPRDAGALLPALGAIDGRLSPPRQQRSPLSGLILLIAFVAILAAGVWAIQIHRQVPVLVAKYDLPAYYQVKIDDFDLETRASFDASEYATLPIEGRLTIEAVRAGEPLLTSDISPDLRGVLGGRISTVGLTVPYGKVFGGTLSTGDPVRLVTVQRGRRNHEISGVVLSVSTAGANSWAVMLALRSKEARAHVRSLAGSSMVILRDATTKPLGTEQRSSS